MYKMFKEIKIESNTKQHTRDIQKEPDGSEK